MLTLCDFTCGRIRLDIETDDDGVRRTCEYDIGLVDRTDTGVDNLYGYLLVSDLLKRILDGLYRTLNVGLDHERKLLDLAGLDLIEECIEGYLLLRLLDHLLLALCNEGGSIGLGLLLVVLHLEDLTRIWNGAETEDLTRL